MTTTTRAFSRSAMCGLVLLAAPVAMAGAHTWDVWEVFSNADGTIQFIEIHESGGGPDENGIGGHQMVANPSGRTFPISHNVASPTSLRSYLLATEGFKLLPGAPTPDDTLPDGFLTAATDTSVTYTPYDTATWAVGTIPTDGIHSLQRPGLGMAMALAVNSPTNYAGTTGSVNASPSAALPGVPDGVSGSPVQVGKLAADGSSLSISWDTATCSGELDHQIIYGQKNGFPGTPGGTYTPLGGACSIGAASPFAWTPTPDPDDGNGLVWFLVVVENNAGTEGPWGRYDAISERNGPGTNGASNVCGITGRMLTNVCGH